MAYSYSDDDEYDNIVQLHHRPELIEEYSTDYLRRALSLCWTIETETTSDGESISMSEDFPEVDDSTVEDEEDVLKDYNTRKMILTNSNVLSKLEVNPVLITSINESTPVPNYKIPVRLYADTLSTKGDTFWNTFFVGGDYADVRYPSLMNTDTVFYDEIFSFGVPYSKVQAKLLKDSATPIVNVYQITCNYYDYNESIQHYQDWSDIQDSERLIPNMYTSLSSHMKAKDEISEMCAGPVDTTVLGGADSEKKIKVKLAGNLPSIYADSILYNVAPVALSPSLNYTMPDNYLSYLALYSHSSSIKESVNRSQQNIIFDRYAIETEESWGMKSINNIDSWRREKVFPYEISIKFPRHTEAVTEDTSDDPVYTTDFSSAEHSFMIRNIIEDRSFSSKFMESLKDTEAGLQPNVEFKNNKYKSWSKLVVSAPERTITDLLDKSFLSMDFMRFLASTYNNPSAAINDDYMFHGLENFDVDSAFVESETHLPTTTYENSALYRYADNQKLMSVMDDILDKLQTYMPLGIQKQEYTTDDTEYDAYISNTVEQAAEIMENLFSPNVKYSEVLAYKIEKEHNGQNIQNFWIFNAREAPDDIEYKDTQVKYGEQYTYNAYAYVAVIAHKYRYGDFRLTKQIGTVDTAIGTDGRFEDDAATPGVPDFYCVQFYDPATKELADQLFAIDFDGVNTDPIHPSDIEAGSRLPQYSALSQRNQWATSQQDLSSHPQLADFHLYVEPCIKIHKIPMFSKTLAPYDNPGNAITSIPFQFLDASKRIGFNAMYEDFEPELYPTAIKGSDERLRDNYLHAKDMFVTEEIVEFSQSPSRFIEVYRIDRKPTNYSDFADALIATIDLKMKNSFLNYSDYIIPSEINTNRKYYYLFRFLTENGFPGQLSKVLQCELIDDGGYIYSLFDTVDEANFGEEVFTNPSKTVKKIFQLEPNMSQMILNDSEVDYNQAAASQVDAMTIGTTEIRERDGSLWDKRFKIRLTSKKTGKKLDINVNFNIQTENFTMTPIEEPE